jgi:hypothetical protein
MCCPGSSTTRSASATTWRCRLVTSLATLGGALRAALENDRVVREAAYGFGQDARTEADEVRHFGRRLTRRARWPSTVLPVRRFLGVLGIAAIAVVAVAVAAGSSDERRAEPVRLGHVARSASTHVVVIVMENKEEVDVLGRSDAPFLTGLAHRYAYVPRSYGIRHPSLPNYIALTSGATHGITDDCEDCNVRARNLVDQLEARHISWKAYMQGMPQRCFTGASGSSGAYRRKHNPFVYYDDVRRDPARCRKIVPMSELAADLRRGRLPTFAWITPDMCNDTHDCDVKTGDRFLAFVVPGLLRALGPRGFLVVTYDEGRTAAGCCGGEAKGGRIATVIAGPRVRRGFRHAGAVDHYGTLATVERALGLPLLGRAKNPRSGRFTDVFRSPPRIRGAA